MRIAFVDTVGWDIDVGSPLKRPLGGAQSAMCYLAIELSNLGHDVIVFAGCPSYSVVDGVECRNLSDFTHRFVADREIDAIIVVSGPSQIGLEKPKLPKSTQLILWSHHAADQPAVQGLTQKEVCDSWDTIVCTSKFHADHLLTAFPHLKRSRVMHITNAIGHPFEGLFSSEADLRGQKKGKIRLAYTSTPFRGLEVLLHVFPAIRREHDVELYVYSSMAVYDVAKDADQYEHVYSRLKSTEGVTYVGSLPQPELAQELSTAHILAFPSTFPEMGCITVIEALAAGLHVVCTPLGGLPENTLGMADMAPPWGFADVLKKAIREYDPARCWRQVQELNAQHTWRVRAEQWVKFLEDAR